MTASLTVDTSAFDRDLDKAKAEVKAFTDNAHKVKIAAEFDTSSIGRARQMFAQLDDAVSKDAMTRLRSSPQGSVLGSLNALFSPHAVTGAPSPQQAASQGLLGQMINGPSGGTGSELVSSGTSGENEGGAGASPLGQVLEQAQNTSTTDDIRQVLQGDTPGNLSTTDDIAQVLQGNTPGNLSTTDDIRQVLEGTTPGNLATTDDIRQVLQGAGPQDATTTDTVEQKLAGQGPKDTATTDVIDQKLAGDTPKDSTTTNTVKEKLDEASAAKVASDSKGNGKQSGDSWGSSFASAAGSALSGLFGGGSGGGEGGGGESFLDKGLIGGLGPGILGISTLKASITGLVGAAVAALPALGGVAAGLTAVAGGAALLFTSNSKLKAQATSLLDSLKSEFDDAAAPMIKPLQDALTSLGATFKSVGPEVGQIFSAAAPLIMPLTTGLEGLVTGLLPGLLTILKSVAPAMDVFDQFLSDVGHDLGTMFADFAPAITDSSVILKALLGIVTGLFPVLGELGATLAGVLGPAFTAFAGAISALEPFLAGVASIIGQFAGAVLSDLGGGLQLVATLLKTVSPAFDTLATSLGQVFNTLESKGGFAQLGDVLEGLAAPLGALVTSLVDGLAPAIPPILTLFSDFVNKASDVAVSVLTSLLPPLTQLATTALGALVAVLPVVVPLVTSLLNQFTATGTAAIITIGTALLNLAQVALDALLQAAQPLIPVLVDLVTAITPLVGILAAPIASIISAVAAALADVVQAIPPGVLTGVAVAVAAVAGGMALWGAATDAVAAGMAALDFTAIIGEIAAFSEAVEGATLAETAMAAGELAVEAVNPVFWAVAAIGGLVALTAAFADSYSGSETLAEAFEAQNNATGYNIASYQKAAAAATQYGNVLDKLTQNTTDGRFAGSEGFAQVSAEATTAAATITQTAATMQSRLTDLSQSFGVSQTQIEQWAGAAGISVQKFESSGESVDGLSASIVAYVNKNAQAVTSTSSLSTNVAIFGDDVFSATTQLDAFNSIWNTLVGNLLTKQTAVSQSATQFQSLQTTIKRNGTASAQTAQSFEAYIGQIGSSVSTLLKNGTSISDVNSYLQTQISNLKSLGPLNKSQQADLTGLIAVQTTLANSTKGLTGNQLTWIQQAEQNIIPDLVKMHADTPLVNTDVKNLADSIAQTGTQSASTESDRAKLISDLESVHVQAGAATTYVNGLITSLGKVPASVTSIITVEGKAQGTLTAISTTLAGQSTQAELALGVAKASGGYISGPGGPTDDMVPAWLSDGEYVIQASSVDKYGKGFLDAVNAQRLATGGSVDTTSGTNFINTQGENWTSTVEQQWAQANLAAFQKELAAEAAASTANSLIHPTGSGATVEALMQSMAASVGWTGAEWTALANVEAREAGFSLTATNPSSGAYGLAQFINGPSEYAQYGGNSTTAQGQITAMLTYVKDRYGDPEAAWAHEEEYRWYANGGVISEPVIGRGLNSGRGYVLGERGSEMVTPIGGMPGADPTMAEMRDLLRQIHSDNQQLIAVGKQAPAATGQHVGAAIGGAAHAASFRARYPRGN